MATLIWPVLAAVIIWRLYPTIQRLISSRAFTIKMGGFEFTAQEAAEKLVQSTAELQSRVAALDREAAPVQSPPRSETQGDGKPRRGTVARPIGGGYPHKVLWVDDIPDRRAYEVAQLKALGITVDIARSTRAALDLLDSRAFDAVVTSLSRSEEGSYSPTAGITLLEAAKPSFDPGSIYVFAANPSSQLVNEVEAAGGRVVKTSMQLFEALWQNQAFAEDTGGVINEGNEA